MAMISNALITGGAFSQIIHSDQRQTLKSAMDRLQEAVAYKAFHNSGERFDHPKCHPNTRIAVRDKIEKWALRTDPDTRHASMLWLSGAAGAGKSAIAQTVAEDFYSKGLLVASFFFGRSDPTRNHARSLVSTILYQLYPLLPPPEQSRVLATIDRDPLIFTRSLLTQLQTLIVIPLQPLFKKGVWFSIGTPRLIIIDGLDECRDRDMQRNVLLMLSACARQFNLPFIFLLSSRPEHDIQAVFSSRDFLPIRTRLFLDNAYRPDDDIELFLRDQFEECRTIHPFRQTIPPNWPSDDKVKEITRKSSGQFIYASVVAKYVKSSRHRPHHRLDVVLKLRPALRDLPFSELDAFYAHILSGVDDIERVLDVISFHILMWESRIDTIETILQLDAGEIAILLCDLAPLIDLVHGGLKILHASLVDYLLDGARSKEYFIDATKRLPDHVADCFQFLSYGQYEDTLKEPARLAMFYFTRKHLSLDLTEHLYNAIKGFSISRIYNAIINVKSGRDQRSLLVSLVFGFLPALFKFLKRLDSAKCLKLYRYHQSEYDLFLRENLKACLRDDTTSVVFAQVMSYRELPIGAFHEHFGFVKKTNRALVVLQLNDIRNHGRDYLEYLSNFLRDPKRSREFCAGPGLFAQAAKCCLVYLCDHTAFAQKAPPRMSAQLRMRRKHTPWKWHRRVLREDVRGPRVTPWLWLRHPLYLGISETRVLHRKTNDQLYVHSAAVYISDPSEYNDPVVKYRVCSEKYYLALIYLSHFLPRAAKLDELVHMCQRLTFASRFQDFRRESAQAWSNMQKYAARWG
ncbi:hypothetical protein D9619_011740 [Psilocybe cf. subviscida]|uniref:Nephrocystin 3-like N-terminal domain-containing protein n=1 Tax=Psilocybe cf. subviscida TaxID=2480587 RepID=A0A8H5B2F0_9AGAR|nr:hypothetical protein D9619_011740 [Psilocybe cf. subviscida]